MLIWALVQMLLGAAVKLSLKWDRISGLLYGAHISGI